MTTVIQRVTASSVTVDGEIVGEIRQGLNILLGVTKEDNKTDVQKLAMKIVNLRIFADEAGKMNRSLLDIGGEVLVISQFTLTGNVRKGRRPSFDAGASPDEAERLYESFIEVLKREVKKVATGRFGAKMDVLIHNDGPVTFIMDSKEI
jgi:D-tyrosyl-tRNA(Tyr) deacylase